MGGTARQRLAASKEMNLSKSYFPLTRQAAPVKIPDIAGDTHLIELSISKKRSGFRLALKMWKSNDHIRFGSKKRVTDEEHDR